jgi:2-polyprenyl-6-methoxyphenol hydroxylase-like FAD-dependent oxidoreductase
MRLVVAADGLRSRSELLVSGKEDPGMQPSGMSVYRTAFPLELAFSDEMVRKRWEGKHTYEFWMGSGMHIGLYMSPEVAALGITPRDEFLDSDKLARSESWDPDVDPDEVIDVMRRAMSSGSSSGSEPSSDSHSNCDSDWHPVLEALVRTAPRGSLIHWPLLWRNLKSEWVSKRAGRTVQIGDAAHSTVPSSAAGGTLALEDAVTLASCLQLAGVGNVALGTRVYNLLRYERASCTQKVAFVNAQTLGHTTDWDDLRRDPEKARLRYPKWLFRHDPESYVYEKWAQASAHLVDGAEFRNTNIPPGHNFVHWNIQDIHKQMAEGKRVEDLLDGDWS